MINNQNKNCKNIIAKEIEEHFNNIIIEWPLRITYYQACLEAEL